MLLLCSDPDCVATEASPRYRICYVGTDGQDEVEFVFFDRLGREIVGKPLISILRSGHSSNTPLEDIVNSTRGDGSIPRELAAVVSTKFRFVVQPAYMLSAQTTPPSVINKLSNPRSRVVSPMSDVRRGLFQETEALADSANTNAAYMLSVQTTPPSVNKLPNPRSRVSSMSDMRRGLFQDTEHHG